jgi:hypothetical protein
MDLSIRDVLTTWRDLEGRLERLAIDDERAEDIRSQIAVLRGAYRHLVDTTATTTGAPGASQHTLAHAREILRAHFLESWSSRRPRRTLAVDWRRVIDRLLRDHRPQGRRCRSCGSLPGGMDPATHQALIIQGRLVDAGLLRPERPRPQGAGGRDG